MLVVFVRLDLFQYYRSVIDLLFPTYLKLVYHQFRSSQDIYFLAPICLEFPL